MSNLRFYQRLNEYLEEKFDMLEKEISPKFKDQLNKFKQIHNKYYQDKIDDYSSKIDPNKEDDYYAKRVGEYKKRQSDNIVDRIYQFLGKDLDIEDAKIEEISTEGLNSKKLRKELNKINCEVGFLIYPGGDYPSEYRNTYKPFTVYKFSIKDGLTITPMIVRNYDGKQFPAADAIPTNSFMKELNSGVIADRTDYLYVAYGRSVETARLEKGRSKYQYTDRSQRLISKQDKEKVASGYYSQYRPIGTRDSQGYNNEHSGYDKSGYYIDIDELKKKFAKYKQSKGSYTKDCEQVISVYENALNKYREMTANWDPRQDFDKTEKLRNGLKSASFNFKYLADAMAKQDGPRIADYLKNCQRDIRYYNLDQV